MYENAHQSWKITDLPWDSFDASRIDPEQLRIIKAAALVEYNAQDYATYLGNIFSDDAKFCQDIASWAAEEKQHGEALGIWAERADPSFHFETAFARFTAGYHINLNAHTSVRGSKSGEMIARCIVETGTSTYYTAIRDATEEPVLKVLCRLIAADEVHHYKLFHSYLERYLAEDKIGRFKRLKISLKRISESEDDELAFAYFSANAPATADYNREANTNAYMARAFGLYRPDHIEHMIMLISYACGFKLPHVVRMPLKYIAYEFTRAKFLGAVKYETRNKHIHS